MKFGTFRPHLMRNVILMILAAAVFGVAVYWWQKPADVPEPSPIGQTQQSGTAQTPEFKPPQGSGASSQPPPAEPPAGPDDTTAASADGPPNYRQELREAEDLLPFAEKLHALAAKGDAAAQYWLSKTLARCGQDYRAAFTELTPKGEQPLSLEEALQRNPSQTAGQAASLRKHHRQCAQLVAANPINRFGLAGDWLQAASNNGYPLAQVETASGRALNAARHGGCAGRQTSCEEARTSALNAVRSSDPEVLVKAGQMVHLLNAEGGNPTARTLEGYAWTLAGCNRGADCSQEQDWVRAWCTTTPNCYPDESGVDFIRRATGTSFAEVERRAQEISQLIDAKQWDELQFH
jgi:hypothetical protein